MYIANIMIEMSIYNKILLFTLLVLPQISFCQYELPNDYNASVVLLNLDNGENYGSGIFYRDSIGIYLITAKHVLHPLGKDNGIKGHIKITAYCKNNKEIDSLKKETMLVDLEDSYKKYLIKIHSTKDIAVIKIGKIDTVSKRYITYFTTNFQWFKQSEYSSLLTVNISNIGYFKDVKATRDVYVFGYPKTIGLEKKPQYDFEAPLIQKGIISAKDKERHNFILNCSVFGGNSGGPVFQVSKLGNEISLIGLVTEYIPYINVDNALEYNSGYSVAVPIEHALELIKNLEKKDSK